MVLTSRRAPSADVASKLSDLEARTGASISVLQGDVAAEADTARILAEVKAKFSPVKGIFHLAGAVDDGAIPSLSWERFQKTLAAKVDGSMYLHEQSLKLDLPLEVQRASSARACVSTRSQQRHDHIELATGLLRPLLTC